MIDMKIEDHNGLPYLATSTGSWPVHAMGSLLLLEMYTHCVRDRQESLMDGTRDHIALGQVEDELGKEIIKRIKN